MKTKNLCRILARLVAVALICCIQFFAAEMPERFHFLPGGVSVSWNAVRTDSAGNIYVAGAVKRYDLPLDEYPQPQQAIFAKLSPDFQILYQSALPAGTFVAAFTVAPDGSAYVGGNQIPGVLPQLGGGTSNIPPAFAAKLDPNGSFVYAVGLPGTRSVSGIAVNGKGEIYVSGSATDAFIPTGGTVDVSGARGFIVKLDTAGTQELIAIGGLGGKIAIDSRDNIYIAATESGAPQLPITSGAFQPTHAAALCGPFPFLISCQYQYAAKLNASGTELLFGTYVAGGFGAAPFAIAVDSDENVYLAGNTTSIDYPATVGAFEPVFLAKLGSPPSRPCSFPCIFFTPLPPNTAYVTKLNAVGSGLLWSTFLGGSASETINDITVTSTGDVYIAGSAKSSDFPGMPQTPSRCLPALTRPLPYAAHLSPDGSALVAAQFAYGSSAFTGPTLAPRPDGSVLFARGDNSVAEIDLQQDRQQTCTIDAADSTQISHVAPGQLISIVGTNLGEEASGYGKDSALPTSLGGVTVTFNGTPAPLLYTSPGQVNVQVPFEVAGSDTADMEVTTADGSSFALTASVVLQQPSAFVIADVFSACNSIITPALQAIARNEDGTFNDCTHRAPAGSVVTVFLNGIGATNPLLTTGVIAGQAVPIAGPTPIQGLTTSPGSISGVSQVQTRVPQNAGDSITLTPSPLIPYEILVWTQSATQ